MLTKRFERGSAASLSWLALVALATVTGCFSKLSPDVANRVCSSDQQCPTGYSCLAPGKPGGCCKGNPCPVLTTSDAGGRDLSSIDVRTTTETAVDRVHLESGAVPGDALPGIDQSVGGSGGSVEAGGVGGSGGATTASTGDSAGSTETGGIPSTGGSPDTGGIPSTGGILSTGGIPDTGGTAAQGGTTGKLDGAVDAPQPVPDAPPIPDAAGTCSADKDCPADKPLCLGNRCAKCAADTDCVGRTGPACAASGLCVGCTKDSYCTGVAAKCDPTTNQCTGCVTRSDCSGVCRTCSNGTCVSIKNQTDPGVCAGTCDSTGACKATQGQTCSATTDCLATLSCADGYCCNSACSGSCQACNVATSPGTCTTLTANTAPKSGHTPCAGTAGTTCAGYCDGTSAACFYPTSSCGTASCSPSSPPFSYQAAGNCGGGSCNLPLAISCSYACVAASGGCTGSCVPGATQCNPSTGVRQLCNVNGVYQDNACGAGTYCSGGACVSLVTNGNPCQSSSQCTSGNCSNLTCCASGQTGCSGVCALLSSSSANCGSCGHNCPAGATCSNGNCYYGDGHTCTGSTDCSSGWCSSFYVDGDHDGYGAGSVVKLCGTLPPSGYASNNTDCCDNDINAHPGSTVTSTSPTGCPSAGGGYDYDCSGSSEKVEHGPHFVSSGNTPICNNSSFGTCAYGGGCTGPVFDPPNEISQCDMYSYPNCGQAYYITTQGCVNNGSCQPTMTTWSTSFGLQACH